MEKAPTPRRGANLSSDGGRHGQGIVQRVRARLDVLRKRLVDLNALPDTHPLRARIPMLDESIAAAETLLPSDVEDVNFVAATQLNRWLESAKYLAAPRPRSETGRIRFTRPPEDAGAQPTNADDEEPLVRAVADRRAELQGRLARMRRLMLDTGIRCATLQAAIRSADALLREAEKSTTPTTSQRLNHWIAGTERLSLAEPETTDDESDEQTLGEGAVIAADA